MNLDEHMSGWIHEAKNRFLDTGHFEETKITSIKRLMGSGLPCGKYHFLKPESPQIEHIFKKIPYNVTRICHKTDPTIRKTLTEITFEKTKKEINQFANPTEDYTIIINEKYPVIYGGIITSEKVPHTINTPEGQKIATREEFRIEIAPGKDLDKISHGKIKPFSAIFRQEIGKIPRLEHISDNPEHIRNLMWSATKQLIKLPIESILETNPNLGYYEFVFTDHGIRFIDYIQK